MKKVLILSPHTDDAELGCGGYISRMVERGVDEITWVVFSTCEKSLPEGFQPNTLKTEFGVVLRYFNIPCYKIYDFEVRSLTEKRQEVLDILVDYNRNLKPDLVIGTSLNDFHQDHGVIANEMIRAFKSSASIISYELPYNHINFQTQLFIKLSEKNIQDKINVLQFYKSQIQIGRPYFSKECVKGLASVRGGQIGAQYAEAFEVVRWIQ